MSENVKSHQETLASMFNLKFHGLSIYSDSEDLFDRLSPRFWDNTMEAYYTAHMKFRRMVLGSSGEPFPLPYFPSCSLVLTERKYTVFKDLYHSPDRFDQLPDWVGGYVNFRASAFVNCIPEDSNQVFNLARDAHEFTHTVLPNELKLSAEVINELWPFWMHESWTVGFHQLRPGGWLANEIKTNNNVVSPTIDSIDRNGYFVHDQRRPESNVAYQYSALMGLAFGNKLIPVLYPDDWREKATPFMALKDLTYQAYRNGRDIIQEAESMGLILEETEREMRVEQGLSY